MQKGYFPTKNILLTQGYGPKSGSHKHSYALDLGGKYRPFAPFDCKVTNIYAPVDKSKSREVWLTSLEKIECANGVKDYLTMSITHPAAIINMRIGQVFKQFQDLGIYTGEMTGKGYSGPHGHVELSLGTQACWDNKIIQRYGEYVNINAIKPEEYLYITKDTNIEKNVYEGDTYNFIKDTEESYSTGVYECNYIMYLRSEPNRNSAPKKVGELNDRQRPACTNSNLGDSALYKKGTNYTAIEIIKNEQGEYWAKTYSDAYICIDDGTTKYCSKI